MVSTHGRMVKLHLSRHANRGNRLRSTCRFSFASSLPPAFESFRAAFDLTPSHDHKSIEKHRFEAIIALLRIQVRRPNSIDSFCLLCSTRFFELKQSPFQEEDWFQQASFNNLSSLRVWVFIGQPIVAIRRRILLWSLNWIQKYCKRCYCCSAKPHQYFWIWLHRFYCIVFSFDYWYKNWFYLGLRCSNHMVNDVSMFSLNKISNQSWRYFWCHSFTRNRKCRYGYIIGVSIQLTNVLFVLKLPLNVFVVV